MSKAGKRSPEQRPHIASKGAETGRGVLWVLGTSQSPWDLEVLLVVGVPQVPLHPSHEASASSTVLRGSLF